MSLHKHELKVNIDDLKSIAKRFRKWDEPNGSSYILYYNKSTGGIWVNEYCSANSWTAYDNKDIIFVTRFEHGGLSQQKIIDHIAARIYNLVTTTDFKDLLYYEPTIYLY